MTKQEAIRKFKANCIGCCHPQAMEYCERNCEYGIAIECIEKCEHEYSQIISKIDDIVYDHTDTIEYKIIISQIYELFGLDWSDNE